MAVLTKVKIVSIVTIILSLILLFAFGLASIVFFFNPLLWIVGILMLIPIVGAIILLISSILMLLGKKAGLYLYMVGWLLNLPNSDNLFGMLLFAWVLFSIYWIRNDEDSRNELKLSDNFFEKSFKKQGNK
jgi:hypothetical protein